nr:MAG: putative RNA-dependent RNA polymerase [Barnaviridae sp.]
MQMCSMSDADLIVAFDLPGIVERDVQPNSSPGVPYVKLARKNSELFSSEANRGLIFSAVVQRVRRILSYTISELTDMSASDFVKLGLADCVKAFIKNEPHKVAKIESGKLRIISNVSIVDQLVERVLCAKQNKLEIKRWKTTPSKPGMGLHDEGLRELYSEVCSAFDTEGVLAETDISGWDWAVQDWLLAFDAELRRELYHAPAGSALAHLLWFRGRAVARKVFCLSDGSLYEQMVPGIQASGSYNTSSTNSRMRIVLAYLVGCRWAIAMGDDDVESFVPGAVEAYEKLGFTVKDYKVLETRGWFDFCSTSFQGSWAGSPSQWLRTVYRYLSHSVASHSVNPQFRAQLVDDFRNLRNQQQILQDCDSIIELESKRCH